jgi:protein TonB
MDRGDETPSGGQAHATSRSWDITPVNFLPDAITIPRLPPVTGDHSTNVIPPDWQLPIGPGNPGIEVIDQSKLDRVPRARSQLAPIYPTDLRCAGVEGTVVVEFKVDLDGSVYSTTVLSATHSGFIDAALRAVGRWKFEPGCTAGKRVRFRMSVPLVFRIDGR